MLESTQAIPDGLSPGQTHFTSRQDRKGLGGTFSAAPGQLFYEQTETINGERAALIKVTALGNIFSLPGLKTYTNFIFSLHVGLTGAHMGVLLHGEGTETSTVLQSSKNGSFNAVAILQRQFTLNLKK